MIDKILVEAKKKAIYNLDSQLDGLTLDEAIDYLVTLGTEVGGEEQKFDKDYLNGEYTLNLVSYRYETDKEYEKRLARLEKVKERKKADRLKKAEKEKKEYERLKAKYGE